MNMTEVSKDRFFATVGTMDVHPHPGPDYSSWETPRREVVGRTEPGYLCRDANGAYANKARYWIADRLAA